jgi:hypothetical protein
MTTLRNKREYLWERSDVESLGIIGADVRNRNRQQFTRPAKTTENSPEKHDCSARSNYGPSILTYYGHSHGRSTCCLPCRYSSAKPMQRLCRTYAGAGPYRSDALDAWVMVIDDELVISNDREGKDRWLTLEETALLRAANADKRAD